MEQLEPEKIIGLLLDRAAGMESLEADCVLVRGFSASATVRLGEIEDVESAESAELGLRLLIGHKQACASVSDLREESLESLFEQTLEMAKAAPDDPNIGLAGDDLLFDGHGPDLEIEDRHSLNVDQLIEAAGEADEAALAVEGVTNSGGASMSYGRATRYFATSRGFLGSYSGTSYSLSATAIAGAGPGMERDYDYCSSRQLGDLDSPQEIGRSAGERAASRLNPKRLRTGALPVVYTPRVANGLLGHLASAINGRAVARNSTFLGEKLGKRIFREGIKVIDDPRRARGLRSRPFDGEGVGTRRLEIVNEGRLASWLLDCATARQLAMTTTGHAQRGLSSAPTPGITNLYLAPGELSPEELISDIPEGVYLTELIGMGVNIVTGDYSRGAAGFRIENGSLTHPVTEVTVAGNLGDMFSALRPASDLEFRYGINSPTVRIDKMMIAGS